MTNELKKYFSPHVKIERVEYKPQLALYLTVRDMFYVEIEGAGFVLIQIKENEKFGVSALKKQLAVYVEALQSNIAFGFETITRPQRDALLKQQIPFVAREGQIYLPFLGVVLSNHFKKQNRLSADKMMPATQQVFLYLLYHHQESILKSDAAAALGLTKTSVTRASEQLLTMGLIVQKKAGREIYMKLKEDYKKALDAAKSFLINPVQDKVYVSWESVPNGSILAGESALSEYSMLNPPRIREFAVYKGIIDKAALRVLDARWDDAEVMAVLELWKYDPGKFAFSGKADPVSLACTLSACNDERIEMAIDEMIGGLEW